MIVDSFRLYRDSPKVVKENLCDERKECQKQRAIPGGWNPYLLREGPRPTVGRREEIG